MRKILLTLNLLNIFLTLPIYSDDLNSISSNYFKDLEDLNDSDEDDDNDEEEEEEESGYENFDFNLENNEFYFKIMALIDKIDACPSKSTKNVLKIMLDVDLKTIEIHCAKSQEEIVKDIADWKKKLSRAKTSLRKKHCQEEIIESEKDLIQIQKAIVIVNEKISEIRSTYLNDL